MNSKQQYEELAEGLDTMRETLGMMVAGLMTEGYSEDQARWLVVGLFTMHLRKDSDEEES